MNQRNTPLGFQQITGLTAAVNLTLPVGAQAARGTSCNLNGKLLTVGGTITGTFGINQVVQGTGIPPNTYITGPGSISGQWILSNACTTETSETVTAYLPVTVHVAIIKCTGQTVMWRDDGSAPTSTIGMPMLIGDPPFEYWGTLTAIQFIQASATAVLDVSYYALEGGS